MSEAPRHSEGGDEKPSTDLDDVATHLATKIGRVLGTDDQGREHVFWPHRGEVTVRERDGLGHVTRDTYDLGAKTIGDYRTFVETEVDDLDVEWYERVF